LWLTCNSTIVDEGISSHRLSGQHTTQSSTSQQTSAASSSQLQQQQQAKDTNKARQEQRTTIDFKLAITLPVVINDASPMVFISLFLFTLLCTVLL
jgi:hypothetical protein